MSYTYLLDANVISDLVRNPTGAVFQQISKIGETRVCTSVVVACELRYGAQKRGTTQLHLRVEGILRRLDVLPLESPVDEHDAEIRKLLEQAGMPIGPNEPMTRPPPRRSRRGCLSSPAR